jgi:diguanylate cyclase (GGDEF)-like protein/PAS domain S-box-containing protein
MSAPARGDEASSMAALRRLQVLDSAPEAEFDALVQVASSICGVPISLISLIDTDRQWFKANVGLPGVDETPREYAFCAHAVLGNDLFEVEDATLDPRFADNPLVVGQPDIRFYAGAPLTLSGGETVGTLCVIDREPRKLTDQQRDVLRQLSVAATKLLEGRLALREHAAAARTAAAVEKDLRLVVENVPAMIAYWNADLTCRFANPAYRDWFGVDPDQLVGKHISELLGPALYELNRPYLEAALQGQVQSFERKITGPSGTSRWSLAQYVPDVVDGKTCGLLVHIADVTSLKSTEDALRLEMAETARAHELLLTSSAELARAQQLGAIGSWSWQVSADEVEWSAELFRIFGCDPAQGAPSFAQQARLYKPDSFARLQETVGKALSTGGAYTLDLHYQRPDGHEGWVEARGEAVCDAAGRITGLRGTLQEVTQRRKEQQALEVAHDRLRVMYEQTPALLHSIDAEGRLLHVSDAWLARLGYRREDVIGRPSVDFLTEASRQRAREQALPALFATGRVDNVPYQLVTRDGEIVDILLSALMERDLHGQPVRSLSVMTDVTARLRAERELAREHERLRNLIEGTNAGTWEWNVQTGEVIVNPRWGEILGWSVSDLGVVTNQFRADIAHPDELEDSRRLLREHFAGRSDAYVAEVRLRHRDGHWIWLEDRGRLITRTADGRPEWMFGIHVDITERKQRDEALQRLSAELSEQHELMRVTLQSMGDAVITTDASGSVTWLNPVAERMTGWLVSEAKGRPLTQVFHIVNEETRALTENPVTTCLAQGKIVGLANHTLLISRDGTEFGIEDSAAPIRNAAGDMLGVVLVFHDVSEQRRMSGEMTYRATHDALTGLVNRAEFEVRLLRLLHKSHEEQSEHALLYVDLDQFKLVNDACGHAIGDQLLQQMGKLFGETVRTRDTLARLGGDEFAIILEHCTADQAAQVAQKICDRMDDFRFIHDDRRFRIGASIGLVPVDKRWASIAAILQAADTSCYAAKEAGRNRVHVWFDTDVAMRARQFEMQWTSRIERALDDDGFVLFAQRMQGLTTAQEGLHAEVLLRMKNEDGTLTQPGAFLPAAERFHLVSRVDRWVLKQAVDWMAALPDISIIDTLSVNLSGQSVGDRAFHAWAKTMLLQAGSDVCSRLCLEITETATVTNLADAAIFIAAVRAAGVKVALDDFGAGASSFGYLKTLPVDYLKIDGQFIRDLTQDPLDDAAVRCFTDVARVVGVKTVAEFVEQPDVLARLRQIGVDYAQGYLIHRPEPIDMLIQEALVPAS